MPTLDISLNTLDSFRFIASPDAETFFAETGVTTREEFAERLGMSVTCVPDLREVTGAIGFDITCMCHSTEDTSPEGKCQESAVRISVMGCVHEHLIVAPLCEWHLRGSLRDDGMWCTYCGNAGHSVLMSEVPVGRGDHIRAWALNMLMLGVTETDPVKRAQIEEFVVANLGRIIPSYLVEDSRV